MNQQAPTLSIMKHAFNARRSFLMLLGFCLWLNASSQSGADLLKNVKTIEQAEAFVEKNKSRGAKLFSISEGKDTAEILLPLYSKKPGYVFSFERYTYKIIALSTSPRFRVNYIYIDGTSFSKNEIDSIRNVIIQQYRSGIAFTELAANYSMDGNLTGDTHWFEEDMMMKDFEVAVRSRKKGDLFTVDIPEKNWYYVVLKTFDDKLVTELTILRTR